MLYNIVLFAFLLLGCVADKAAHGYSHQSLHKHQLRNKLSTRADSEESTGLNLRQTSGNDDKPPRLANATASDIEEAKALITAAKKKSTELNKARVAAPSRNQYKLDPNTKFGKRQIEGTGDAPPILNITEDIRAAAALIAELEAYNETVNGNFSAVDKRQSGSWWMGNLAHTGGWPWGSNPSGFKVRPQSLMSWCESHNND